MCIGELISTTCNFLSGPYCPFVLILIFLMKTPVYFGLTSLTSKAPTLLYVFAAMLPWFVQKEQLYAYAIICFTLVLVYIYLDLESNNIIISACKCVDRDDVSRITLVYI